MTPEQIWEKFIEQLVAAIDGALEKGHAARLLIGNDEREVIIDVYSSPEQLEKLGKALELVAKKEET